VLAAADTSPPVQPAAARLRDERGFTLIELLISISMFAVVLGAIFGALSSLTTTATVTSAYSAEVQDAQEGIARITHDLRSAYSVVAAQPNSIEVYEWANVSGATVTMDVKYDCSVHQPNQIGTSYNECTRVQTVLGSGIPLPLPSTGVPTVLRLVNGGITTYCNSNAVFHYISAASNGSTAACTEALSAAAAINPVFVEVRILVPAKGQLTGVLATGSFQHTTVLDGGGELYNTNLANS
jgi:prepilin-type N-terminal cleavage/methylation domain-containing protein